MKLPPLPELPEPTVFRVGFSGPGSYGDGIVVGRGFTADQVNALLESYGRAVQQECARLAPEPCAWLHRQGNHTEVSERQLDADEIARGWTQDPLYTSAIRSTE